MNDDRYDLVTIGGGSGGLTTAIFAARVGAKVLLVDRERLGGDCLYYGCVPSKALIASARAAHRMRRAETFGLRPVEVTVDFPAVMQRIARIQQRIAEDESPEALERHGVEVAFGGARFIDEHTIEVGSNRRVHAERSIIATGSHAVTPDIPGLAQVGSINHVGLFEITELPRRWVVLGAGPIGMEMGQALARLGAEITILQRGSRVLKRDDAELTALLARYVRAELRLVCGASVREVRRSNGAKAVVFEANGDEETLDCDQILTAVGRKPNLEGLGLDEAGVAFNERGIIVDETLRTTARNIWACGDCVGSLQFTHFAEAQARVVTRNALFAGSQKHEARSVPWVTFTDPELAHVGLTEAQARRAHKKLEVYRFPYEKLDRAICDGEVRGLAKVVCAPSGQILGASILGPHAGEAIMEIVIATETGITIQKLSSFVHAYPIMNRIVRRLGDERFLARGVGAVTKKLLGRYRGGSELTRD